MNAVMSAKRFVQVANVNELQNSQMTSFRVEKRDILVALVNGKYYAADNKCPHLGGDLSMGRLKGTVVTCPRHASQFDLVDGSVLRWTNWTGWKTWADRIYRGSTGQAAQQPLRVYPVKVEGDNILVGF